MCCWCSEPWLDRRWMIGAAHSVFFFPQTLHLTGLSLWWLLTVACRDLLRANVVEREPAAGAFTVPQEPSRREFQQRCSSADGYSSAELKHLQGWEHTLQPFEPLRIQWRQSAPPQSLPWHSQRSDLLVKVMIYEREVVNSKQQVAAQPIWG